LLQIYPTSVTPYTKIEEWYRAGLYKPYADEDNGEKLIEVLIWFKERVQVPRPWSFGPKLGPGVVHKKERVQVPRPWSFGPKLGPGVVQKRERAQVPIAPKSSILRVMPLYPAPCTLHPAPLWRGRMSVVPSQDTASRSAILISSACAWQMVIARGE
jgi:hypothetical protein